MLVGCCVAGSLGCENVLPSLLSWLTISSISVWLGLCPNDLTSVPNSSSDTSPESVISGDWCLVVTKFCIKSHRQSGSSEI